jgi:hypothetical protein
MDRKPRKGDHLIYVGEYDPSVTARYSPGVVVGFRNYGAVVTVELDDGKGWADWPVDEVELA